MTKEEEQDGVSVHSPSQAPRSSASSLPKEQSQVDIELRLLQALEMYPPAKLQASVINEFELDNMHANILGGIHRHFVLYGLIEHLQKCFERSFSADEVLQLLNQFFNLEMLKPDEDEVDIFKKEEEFSLPHNLLVKEEE